jgi:two-component system, OmpR family, response regulator
MAASEKDSQLRVLVVEDSVLTAEQIKEVLQQATVPIDIKVVHTQTDALSHGKAFSPDVIVLDLLLREGTGFTVLKEFSASKPKPAILVFTNYALPNYRNFALLTGANYFLDKAKDSDQLPTIVDSIAHSRGIAATQEKH